MNKVSKFRDYVFKKFLGLFILSFILYQAIAPTTFIQLFEYTSNILRLQNECNCSAISQPLRGKMPIFFVFVGRGIFLGDWGVSFQDGRLIGDILDNQLIYYFTDILLVSIFSIGIIYGIISRYKKKEIEYFPAIFTGNWLLFPTILLLSFMGIFLHSIDVIPPERSYFSPFGSMMSILVIVATTLLSVISLLRRLSLYHSKPRFTGSELTFPTNEDGEPKNSSDKGKLEAIEIDVIVKEFRQIFPDVIGYHLVISILLQAGNFPYYLQLGLFTANFSLIFVIIFGMFFIYFIFTVILAAIEIFHFELDVKLATTSRVQPSKSLVSKLGTYGLISLLIFSILVIWFGILAITIGLNTINSNFNPRFGIFRNPFSISFNEQNLKPMVNGYILGTDGLGRSVFSLLLLVLWALVGPVTFGIIFRSVISLLIIRFPNNSILRNYVSWFTNIPKLPTLILIYYITYILDILMIFYLVSAILFTPYTIKWASDRFTSGIKMPMQEVLRRVYYLLPHIVLSIVVEIFLVRIIFYISYFNLRTTSIMVLVNNLLISNSYGISNAIQILSVISVPAFFITVLYMKTDTVKQI